jgi:hypothetical protein
VHIDSHGVHLEVDLATKDSLLHGATVRLALLPCRIREGSDRDHRSARVMIPLVLNSGLGPPIRSAACHAALVEAAQAGLVDSKWLRGFAEKAHSMPSSSGDDLGQLRHHFLCPQRGSLGCDNIGAHWAASRPEGVLSARGDRQERQGWG